MRIAAARVAVCDIMRLQLISEIAITCAVKISRISALKRHSHFSKLHALLRALLSLASERYRSSGRTVRRDRSNCSTGRVTSNQHNLLLEQSL